MVTSLPADLEVGHVVVQGEVLTTVNSLRACVLGSVFLGHGFVEASCHVLRWPETTCCQEALAGQWKVTWKELCAISSWLGQLVWLKPCGPSVH